jgi:hypothetical protein
LQQLSFCATVRVSAKTRFSTPSTGHKATSPHPRLQENPPRRWPVAVRLLASQGQCLDLGLAPRNLLPRMVGRPFSNSFMLRGSRNVILVHCRSGFERQ